MGGGKVKVLRDCYDVPIGLLYSINKPRWKDPSHEVFQGIGQSIQRALDDESIEYILRTSSSQIGDESRLLFTEDIKYWSHTLIFVSEVNLYELSFIQKHDRAALVVKRLAGDSKYDRSPQQKLHKKVKILCRIVGDTYLKRLNRIK